MKKLSLPEWFFSSTFLLLLLSLLFIAKKQFSLLEVPPLSPKMALVNITGHVAKPGIYPAEVGTPLSLLIRRAKPKRFADLSPFEGRVEQDLELEVLPLSELTVWIEGIFPLRVPVKTRVCDLKKFISHPEEVDLEIFKKRRFLREEEEIFLARRTTCACGK